MAGQAAGVRHMISALQQHHVQAYSCSRALFKTHRLIDISTTWVLSERREKHVLNPRRCEFETGMKDLAVWRDKNVPQIAAAVGILHRD